MPKYNGHKDWDHWNVSLWINNDEPLYRMALRHARSKPNLRAAATAVYEGLGELGITETPDGATYTVETIEAAMEGMDE